MKQKRAPSMYFRSRSTEEQLQTSTTVPSERDGADGHTASPAKNQSRSQDRSPSRSVGMQTSVYTTLAEPPRDLPAISPLV